MQIAIYSQICTGSYVQLYTSNYRCVDIYVQLYVYNYMCTDMYVQLYTYIYLYRYITASTYLNAWLNAIRTALAWRNVKGECVPAQTCQNKLLIRHFADSTATWNAWIVTEWVCDRILRCKEISISKERHSKHNAVQTYNSHTRPGVPTDRYNTASSPKTKAKPAFSYWTLSVCQITARWLPRTFGQEKPIGYSEMDFIFRVL